MLGEKKELLLGLREAGMLPVTLELRVRFMVRETDTVAVPDRVSLSNGVGVDADVVLPVRETLMEPLRVLLPVALPVPLPVCRGVRGGVWLADVLPVAEGL